MAVSLEQFSRQLAESGVLSEPDLRAFVDKLPAVEKPADGEQLAKRLVKEKKISAYQAQVVYSGKGKTLTMGSYFVLDKLGQGGMGMVLKAEHRMMKRLVAIKVLSPAVTKTKELAQRFQREVEAAARLTHPNIVGAFDAGETNGSPFLVMEYVPGDDLSSIVKKKGPLSVDQAIDCIAQAAKGLEFAHSQGVIHRDIKPANLLMDTKGVVKILDMGLARIEATDVATQADLTGTGAVMGTVDYMAPEQALSTKHADARSDLYSLGISLWYLLTGKAAYEGDSLMARLLAHREQPIPSLRAVRGDVPESLDHLFEKLVAKKQADRYQTATELLVDLQSCRTGASIKAVTVAEVATGPDEFQNFLHHLDSPTEGPRGGRSNPLITGTKTVARSQASMTSTDETMPPTPASETQRFRRPKSREVKSPPWFQDRRLQIAGGAAVLVLLAAVFLFQTPNGTLRVEILDPEVEMTIKGTDLKFHGADLDPVSLKVGEKKLLVTRGNESFATESIEIKKGKETRVKVELIGDNLVVNSGGKVIAEQPIKRKALTTSTTGGDSVATASQTSRTSAPPLAKAPFDAKQARLHQEAWARHLGLPLEYTNSIGMKFVLIPPGEFTMGITPEQFQVFRKVVPDEHGDLMLRRAMPAHVVRITKPFYLQVAQVRLSQFTTLLGRKPPVDAELDTNDNLWRGVSWHDAIAFCNKLSEQEKRQVVYTVNGTETQLVSGAVGYRLPTEAEFEYASRAGTDTFLYFGNDSAAIQSHVRLYSGDNVLANPFGLIEIFGGTLNWCWDAAPQNLESYSAELLKQTNDPIGKEGPCRIRRGGLFFAGGGQDVRQNNSFYRTSDMQDSRDMAGLGRIVLMIPERAANPPAVAPGKPMPQNGDGIDYALERDCADWLRSHHNAVEIRIGDQLKVIEHDQPLPTEKFTLEKSARNLAGPETGAEIQPRIDKFARLHRFHGGYLPSVASHQWAVAFAKMPNVTHINAYRTNIQDEDLALFAAMPKLEYLSVDGCQKLTGKGIRNLAASRSLKVINLWDTSKINNSYTLEDVQALQEALPLCTITRGSGEPIPGLAPAKGLGSGKLFMHDPAFPQWIKDVHAMPVRMQLEAVCQKLVELNPEFDGKLTGHRGKEPPNITEGVVTGLGFATDNMTDISPIRALSGITHLKMNGSDTRKSKFQDLSPLEGLQLTTVAFSNSGVANLEPLRGMPLTEVEFIHTKVSSLAPLREMPLKIVRFGGIGMSVSDLSPLRDAPLTHLLCTSPVLSDLSPLAGKQLLSLDIQGTKVSDIGIVADMPLRFFFFAYDPGNDAHREFLKILRSIKTLEIINFKPVAEFWKIVDGK